MCDEIKEVTKTASTKTITSKTVPANFNEKKIGRKMKNFYILLILILTHFNHHITTLVTN